MVSSLALKLFSAWVVRSQPWRHAIPVTSLLLANSRPPLDHLVQLTVLRSDATASGEPESERRASCSALPPKARQLQVHPRLDEPHVGADCWGRDCFPRRP